MQKREEYLSARINGNNLQPLAGASVTVTDNATGLPAVLYQDDELTVMPQPLITNDQGYFGYKASNGEYTETYSGVRFPTFTGQVVLLDPSDAALTLSASVMANLAASDGANKIGYGSRKVADKLGEFVSVKDAPFNAKGDGVTDDTAAIQAAIDATRGKLHFPRGTYVISSTLLLKPETILVGAGAGAYFQGTGYPRVSVIQPTSGFTGADVIRVDPADVSTGLSYSYGIAARDILIDCINIKNAGKNIVNLLSLSNAETFDGLRIINNNNNTAIHIGKSANAASFESDGLVFANLYTLACDGTGASTNPVIKITAANEVAFRDSKIQGGASSSTVGSAAVLLSAQAGRAINSITFDGVAFTGAETGVRIEGKDADGQGPRHIRMPNCTTEGVKFGFRAFGTASRPAQFITIGPGNRHIAMAAGGAAVVLDAYASNCQVFADEATDVTFGANSSGNLLYGGGTFTDGGTNNARLSRTSNKISLSGLHVENWIAPTLGSGWVSNTASRTTAAYRKDVEGVVRLRGYLTGGTFGFPNYIFTLPVGYRPVNGCEFAVANDNAAGACKLVVLATGEVFASGGSGSVSLDGVDFSTT